MNSSARKDFRESETAWVATVSGILPASAKVGATFKNAAPKRRPSKPAGILRTLGLRK